MRFIGSRDTSYELHTETGHDPTLEASRGSEFAHGDVGSDLARRKLRRENTDLDSDNTQALHPSLKLIGTCAQEFKGMTRRAVVYVKIE